MKIKTLTLFIIFWLLPLSILQCEEWSLIIYANDVQGISNDLVFLGLCETCHDEFHYGEDEYNTPPPPDDYVDIRSTNFEWIGYTDEKEVEFEKTHQKRNFNNRNNIWKKYRKLERTKK